jgi:hypothetical protein
MTPEDQAILDAAKEWFFSTNPDPALRDLRKAVEALHASKSPLPRRQELAEWGHDRDLHGDDMEWAGAFWLRWVAEQPDRTVESLYDWADELEKR